MPLDSKEVDLVDTTRSCMEEDKSSTVQQQQQQQTVRDVAKPEEMKEHVGPVAVSEDADDTFITHLMVSAGA